MVLELLSKKVTVDTVNIAKGLKEIDPKIHIGFGMFKAELMRDVEQKIKAKVYSTFDQTENELFKSRINRFVSDCMHQITVNLLN